MATIVHHPGGTNTKVEGDPQFVIHESGALSCLDAEGRIVIAWSPTGWLRMEAQR